MQQSRFDPDMAWAAKSTGKRGRQPVYSEAAVQVAGFQIRVAVLNGFTALGIPVTKVVG